MVSVFSLTIALGAFLLFLVQPMAARMLLPPLGGAPAVWTACVLFFQAALLAGYAYAHVSLGRLGPLRQPWVHIGVLAVAAIALPIAPAAMLDTTRAAAAPLSALLGALLWSVALPFFAVAATAPTLQAWFARTDHARAHDPYFLYAASNLGSFAALAAYPILVEPTLPLRRQAQLWSLGYAALAVAMAACAVLARSRTRSAQDPTHDEARAEAAHDDESPRLKWLTLAAVPSSLMLGVTSYISTDVAAVPFLWIAPLALYLATYIAAFGRRSRNRSLAVLLLPVAVIAALAVMLTRTRLPMVWLVAIHLATFTSIAYACHSELARLRPHGRRATTFYLWASLGGAIGGLFNTLAPYLFTDAYEYPIALVAAAMTPALTSLPTGPARRRDLVKDVATAMAIGACAVAAGAWATTIGDASTRTAASGGVVLLTLGACAAMFSAPRRFGLSLAAVWLASLIVGGGDERVFSQERTFFGVARVTEDREGQFTLFYHGSTIHGLQAHDAERRAEPLGYFHRRGPAGQVLEELQTRRPAARVVVVGLGVGAMAAYAAPSQRWSFIEIDPAVLRAARDGGRFTFLQQARAPLDILLGDGRLQLASLPDAAFDAIVLDAFSSDAIPVHLITREAFALYLRKLAPDGVLLANISNTHVNLQPVIGAIVRDGDLRALVRLDLDLAPEDWNSGRFASSWVAIARRPQDLGAIAHDDRWRPLASGASDRAWTDDYSSLWSVLNWSR